MESEIYREYNRVLDYCQSHPVPAYMLQMSQSWQNGLWKAYRDLIEMAGMPIAGKVVVDLGCKWGHIMPLLLAMGAVEVIGIEAEDVYLEGGISVFETLYSSVRFVKSEMGFLPLQPESADLILVNEVISHVNPAFLETVYAEIARILKPNGRVLISDGNNIGNAQCRAKLPALYNAWENGPEGVHTDRDTVEGAFVNLRSKIIQERYPDLTLERVEYLAQNTSGLFGEYLLKVIDEYVKTNELIRRPYLIGIYPTNPNPSGVVMERGFHPMQVEMSLASYSLIAYQILPKRTFGNGILGRAKALRSVFRDWMRDVKDPEWRRGESEGFQILGIKP